MKKILFTAGLFVTLAHAALFGQAPYRSVPKSWIQLTNNRTISEVYLYELRDSSIAISNVLTTKEPIDFSIENIDLVTIQKENNSAVGIVIGLGIGAAVGGIVGLASLPKCDENDIECEVTNFFASPGVAIVYGGGFALGGALIGGLVGANAKLKIPINGNYEKYHEQKEKLRQYSIIK